MLLLGSTGSIGTSTLQIVDDHSGRFRVVALVARRSVAPLEDQVRRYQPQYAVMTDPAAARDLRDRVRDTPTKVLSGTEGLLEVIASAEFDIALHGISGAAGVY